jgi:HlyD family secretion protein
MIHALKNARFEIESNERSPDAEDAMSMDKKVEKKKWPPKKIALIAGSVLFVVFVVYVFLFKFRVSSLNVEKERITISAVSKGPFQEYIAIIGNVLPRFTYELSALESGTVEERYIEAGTPVKKGDRILKLTNSNLVLDIMWREADFYNASNNLRTTRLSMEQYKMTLLREKNDVDNSLLQQKRLYDRYSEMTKSDLISKHEYELAKDQYEYLLRRKDITIESQKNDLEFRQVQLDALDETVKRLQESLNLAKKRLDNLIVRAPVTGFLTALDADVGQTKMSGARLGQIDVLDGYKVRALIDENYLPRVQAGKSGNFELADKNYKVVVRKVFPEVNKEGRFEVDLDFVGIQPEGITRGQSYHIQLNLSDVTECVLVAKGGFYNTTGGNWVFVVDKTGKYGEKRAIKIGRQNTAQYEVLEGLQPGDQVITSSYESFGTVDRLILK